MKTIQKLGYGAALAALCLGAAQAQTDDPYAWLEDVSSDKALSWVKERNAATVYSLASLPGFAATKARIQAALDSMDRIPYVQKQGRFFYNFWRDAQHPRGYLRRTTLASYTSAAPKWEVVLDIDQLAADEHENWVWGRMDCVEPRADRCLVFLTRGGGDAHVVREFDPAKLTFVAKGFNLPEAKGEINWIDRDHLYVATDFGPGSQTTSGYARIVKEWARGTPLADARTVFAGQPADTSVAGYADQIPGYNRKFVVRRTSFFTNETYSVHGSTLTKIDKPNDADAYTFRDQLLVELRSDWTTAGKTYAQGSLLAIGFDKFMAGDRHFSVLYAPTKQSALRSVAIAKDALLLTELVNVRSRVTEIRRVKGKWVTRQVATPEFATVSVMPLDAFASNQYFVTTNDFLTPTTLYLGTVGSDQRQRVKSLPAFFDASALKVEQHFATAKDGTQIPYFVVARKDLALDGSNPTLLYGYGGFELSMLPSYSATLGRAWLEQGGVYVLANIRGGGEFGPRWHQAALKEHRQVSYDDFVRVAQDLIDSKITTPRHLGIMGGSLGGMLVAVSALQHPELFNAVVSQVPLADMKRYHKLLAGASWIDEYGDPDIPEQWDYISKYSPYHLLAKDRHYPPIFFTSSTRDDRVHPAHARKMVAKMEEQGHTVLYWENTDGGHGGAVNSEQQAQLYGMIYSFLWDRLK